MKSHTLHLHSGPFTKILVGKKIIESRLNDEKRRAYMVNDELIFVSREDGNRVPATITALHHFPTFAAMFSNMPAEKFGGNSPEALLQEITQFYSAEEQAHLGVVGIEFVVT